MANPRKEMRMDGLGELGSIPNAPTNDLNERVMKEFWYQSGKQYVDREWFSSYEEAEEFARKLSLNDGWCNIVEYDEEGQIRWIAPYENGIKRTIRKIR